MLFYILVKNILFIICSKYYIINIIRIMYNIFKSIYYLIYLFY